MLSEDVLLLLFELLFSEFGLEVLLSAELLFLLDLLLKALLLGFRVLDLLLGVLLLGVLLSDLLLLGLLLSFLLGVDELVLALARAIGLALGRLLLPLPLPSPWPCPILRFVEAENVGLDLVVRALVGESVCVVSWLNPIFLDCLVARGVGARRLEKACLPVVPRGGSRLSDSVLEACSLSPPLYSSDSPPLDSPPWPESLKSAASKPKTCFAFVR